MGARKTGRHPTNCLQVYDVGVSIKLMKGAAGWPMESGNSRKLRQVGHTFSGAETGG